MATKKLMNLPKGSVDGANQFFEGGLKFVRWDYTAKNRTELSVRRGDEVELVKSVGNKFWKVKLDGRSGLIPARCFYRRIAVCWNHAPEDENEVAVAKGEVVGIMEKDVGDAQMIKIMKEDGSEGLVPQHCFYRRYEVYSNYTRTSQEELTIKAGDVVGLIDRDTFGVFWKVYLKGKVGLVPGKCFEPFAQVHWDYEARKPDDLTVKKGDTVSMVDFESGMETQRIRVRVRLGDEIGYIPSRCFELPAEVYKDYNGVSNSDLFVKKGDIVGIIDSTDVPDGFLKVRLGDQTGFIPKECFEIPATVIKTYKAARVSELSVTEGQEVHVIDATAYIQVRLGHAKGEVPLKCINIDVRKIVRLLEKSRDDDNMEEESTSEYEGQPAEAKLHVDERALGSPLGLGDSKTAIGYLKDVPIGSIVNIGLTLGLTFETLQKMSTEKIHEEMVIAWLSKKDGVATTGIPTWKSLGAALQKVNMSQITKMILRDNTRLVLGRMLNIQWYDDSKMHYQMSIVNEGCGKWREIGSLLEMQAGILDGISHDKHDNASRFTKVLEHWISTGGNANYPATWIGLQNVLCDSEQGILAQKIKEALPFLDI